MNPGKRGKNARPPLLTAAREYLRTQSALRLLVCVLGVLLLVAQFVVAIVPPRYDLRVGMVPTTTIAATKDVVDEIATEKKREDAARAVTPTYHLQEDVTDSVLTQIDQVFQQLRAVRAYGESLITESGEGTHRFSADELAYARNMLTLITLRDYQLTTLLGVSFDDLEALYTSLYAAVKNTMSGTVTEGQEKEAISSIRQIIGYRTAVDLLQNVADPVLQLCIRANMVIDQEATEAAREEARNAVEPVVYKQGQNIVVQGGERITANQIQMLRSLGLLYDGQADMTMYVGGALLVGLSCALLLAWLRLMGAAVMRDLKRLIILITVLLLTLGLCILLRLLDIYFAPVLLAAMLLTNMLGAGVGAAANVAVALMVSALAAGSSSEGYSAQMVHMVMTALLSGTLVTVLLRVRTNRTRVLLAGLAASALNLLVMIALGLMTNSDLTTVYTNALWSMGGGVSAALFCVGLQPLLEALFNIATPAKLLELSNPNQPLMRRLLIEAPGTYHHSIIVANLAEAAAEAIGANPLLARVGSYFHDIGKLKRPLYFKENQMGENPHDHTDPYVSAAIVTAHVRDGLALAKSYHIPDEVQELILSHHGDTPAIFFYHKALQQANGKSVDIKDFRYDGVRPRTKEAAIIMLADTIEAAVRSMEDPTPERIEEFIVRLVRGKLEDGQLSESPLTLKDIDKICEAFSTVLVGVFHERIEYPDMKLPQAGEPKPPEQAPEAPPKAPSEPVQAATESAPNMPEQAPEVPPKAPSEPVQAATESAPNTPEQAPEAPPKAPVEPVPAETESAPNTPEQAPEAPPKAPVEPVPAETESAPNAPEQAPEAPSPKRAAKPAAKGAARGRKKAADEPAAKKQNDHT